VTIDTFPPADPFEGSDEGAGSGEGEGEGWTDEVGDPTGAATFGAEEQAAMPAISTTASARFT